MAKGLDNKEMLKILTSETQQLISEFLRLYMKSSHAGYISAFSNLFYVVGKEDASDLDFADFHKIQEHYKAKKNKSTHTSYIETFFKYLFVYDKIKNPKGFEKIWIKDVWRKHFESLLNKIDKSHKVYSPSLTIEDISKIDNLMNIDYQDNFEMLKMSFLWYMLFCTNCSISGLRDTNVLTIINQKINISGEEFEIPDKYLGIFQIKIGFNNLNRIIRKLGKIVGINDLKPQTIRNAMNDNMIKCSQCGVKYKNSKENWVSVNNLIVCKECANLLKKNDSYMIEDISNVFIEKDIINDDINISSIIYTYDELKKKLSPKVDYLKLHKFQMEIGKLGEAYIYDWEKEKLKGTKYEEYVDNTPSKDHNNGYDLLSYDFKGNEIYIEVKTEVGQDNDFYITANELETAKKLINERKRYLIYRVHNILAQDKKDIKIDIIDNILEDNNYLLEQYVWKVKKVSRL